MKDGYPSRETTATYANFELQKRRYFVHLAASHASAFKVHIQQGLWERNPDGTRDWGNVSEHCLVETARVGTLADMVGLGTETKRDLRLAAALHDVYKKGEKEIMQREGLSWESYEEAGRQSDDVIRAAGFSDDVAKLAGSVGHGTVIEAEALASKPDQELTDFDKAWFIMHYVDDYTINSSWAVPSEVDQYGRQINEIDRRMDKNEANPRYTVMNEAGRRYFGGETSYQAQRRVGHMVENRLAGLISGRHYSIDPVDLPIFVDDRIRDDILQFTPTPR